MNSTEAQGQGILLIVNLNEHSNSINVLHRITHSKTITGGSGKERWNSELS